LPYSTCDENEDNEHCTKIRIPSYHIINDSTFTLGLKEETIPIQLKSKMQKNQSRANIS